MRYIMTFLIAIVTSTVFAQKTHFQMSSLRPDADSAFVCRVTGKFDNRQFIRYTGCTMFPYTKTRNAKVRVSVDADEVPRFLDFLEKVRDKYDEWAKTAADHKIRGFSKRMPVEMKSKGGIWSIYYVDGKPPRSSFDMNKQWEYLVPFFKVDSQGRCFVEWSTGKLEYSVKSGNYGLGNFVEVERCDGGLFLFSSTHEIQSLIDCFKLSPPTVDNHFDDLFQ